MSRPNASAQESYIALALEAERDVSAATSQKQALSAAISAVENYMKALKITTDANHKQKLDIKCKEWLTKAENIKATKDWRSAARPGANTATGPRTPSSTRKLTTREEIILLEGAKLNGFIFPPCVGPLGSEEFQQEIGREPFTDEPDLHLSNPQREIFAGWKRPRELLSTSFTGNKESISDPVMFVPGKTDLVQDVLTDCSVVASLCATTAKSERGSDKYFLPQVHPCDEEGGKPLLSPSGKYIFCFYFNGCFRKVVIDDRLPSSKTSRTLHMIDRNNPNFLWPALVEKAYLKVRGGYDFPGSNSGTDLWVLTGWIPEQVFLHNEDITADQLWRRLFRAFHYGDVLLTVGTGELTETEQKALGLVSEHDYAILDMKESNGRRQMLVKNPWAGDKSGPECLGSKSADTQNDSAPLSPGSFWMDCENVLQHFENLYLNWNPGLFKYREDIHFTWDLVSGRGIAGCFAKNPQFSITTEAGGHVWLVLGKHFRTTRRCQSSNVGLSETEEHGFISIYVFKAGGQRVCLSDGFLHRGPYVDSPNTLLRFEMPPNTTYTAVVSEQSLPAVSQNFTLSTFSRSPVKIAHARDRYAFVTKAHGAWTPSTAGGNAESARYSTNPQFSLEISETADLSILLETEEADLAMHVNVKLFWSNGKRIARVRSRDIIADSGDYRRGCALAETKSLGKGSYTIVCSTFAPGLLGTFSLRVSTTSQCVIKPLAAESAGRRVVVSDIGILPPGRDRILAPLRVPRLTRLKLIARSRLSMIGSRTVAPSPMLMTVELGQGPYKEVLASSEDGVHGDTAFGIRVDDFDLQPALEQRGGVWIVIERVGGPGGQVEDHVEVEALAEERVEIGEWRLEDE